MQVGGITHPSGKTLMICLPIMRDEFCKMRLGRTLFSETDNSLSKSVFISKSSHPSIGSCYAFSGHPMINTSSDLLEL